MKRALDGLLPREILDRKKRGFGAPMGAWLKAELRRLLRVGALARGGASRAACSGTSPFAG